MNLKLLGEVFVTLLVIVDPPGMVPVFLALTGTLPARQRHRAGTQADITLQFVANGVYWEHTLPAGTPSGVVKVPFTSFAQPSWAPSGTLDLRQVTQFSIYLGGSDAGRLTVDEVSAYPSA